MLSGQTLSSVGINAADIARLKGHGIYTIAVWFSDIICIPEINADRLCSRLLTLP